MRANHLSNKSSSLPEAVDAGAGGADAAAGEEENKPILGRSLDSGAISA